MKTLLLLCLSLFAASGVLSAQSIAGDWNGAINTPGGARPMKLVFTQEGEKLTGTVTREAGDVPLQGTVKGTAVEFSYTVMYNGSALILSVTAKLDGDSMKGTVSFGGQAEDEFSATRARTPAGGTDTAPPESAFTTTSSQTRDFSRSQERNAAVKS